MGQCRRRAQTGNLLGPAAPHLFIWPGPIFALLRRAAARHPLDLATLDLLPPLVYATPPFFFALVLAVPVGSHLAGPRLPYEAAAALATALPAAAFFGQILHRALAEELGRPYVRTALAKGLGWNAVVWRHAFPNAALVLLDGAVPKVTLLLTGSFIAERIFNVQGFGFLYVHAALERCPDLGEWQEQVESGHAGSEGSKRAAPVEDGREKNLSAGKGEERGVVRHRHFSHCR